MAIDSGKVTMDLPGYAHHLKRHDAFPSNIEVSDWGRWHLVSCYDKKSNSLICESVSMGIDLNPEIAVLKGITEYCERSLSKMSSDPVCKLTERSDGFAAYPVFNNDFKSAVEKARENALDEATERFLWASWWDRHGEVSYRISDPMQSPLRDDFRTLIDFFKLRSVREIQIDETKNERRLSIFVAETSQGGFVTGGSCSQVLNPLKRWIPAFGELLRHLIVVDKMQKNEYAPKTFYEKRLKGFGLGHWRSAVVDRLEKNVGGLVELPRLIADQEVNHSAMDVVRIYRCLYEHQPQFMGGDIDRLCI